MSSPIVQDESIMAWDDLIIPATSPIRRVPNRSYSPRMSKTDSPVIRSDECKFCVNKANLRDLIAATGLVILLKLD